MRVITGSARGLKLKAPKGLKTRPTTDRIKESLFNIISPDIYGCRFLDLFSGSGAIAIEALSRGAECAVLVDAGDESIGVIRDNLSAARLADKAEVVKSNVSAAVERLGRTGRQFDIIFMDPPYNRDFVLHTIEDIVKFNVLSDDGYIVAEQSQDDDLPCVEGLTVYRVKDYKITKMTFLRKDV